MPRQSRDEREHARRVEAFIVPELVRVIHPIFYPVEQQDCAIQRRNHAKMTEVARRAWRAFVKLGSRLALRGVEHVISVLA